MQRAVLHAMLALSVVQVSFQLCVLFCFCFLSAKTSFHPAAPNSMKTVLVYFLGGCTFAEVAALRMLAQRESKQHIFLWL